MKNKLLIVGAGIYGVVTKEIAETTGRFGKIAFVDDGAECAPDGSKVIGKVADLKTLSHEYDAAIVAIGNPQVRSTLLQRLQKETDCRIVSLISPSAYVSPRAQIGQGCIIEPMAVVHAKCVLEEGCLVSAGAVVNHGAVLRSCVHVDCNATVAGFAEVPAGQKIQSGEVLRKTSEV